MFQRDSDSEPDTDWVILKLIGIFFYSKYKPRMTSDITLYVCVCIIILKGFYYALLQSLDFVLVVY